MTRHGGTHHGCSTRDENDGTINVWSSTFQGNHGEYAGVFENYGALNIADSTIANNTSRSPNSTRANAASPQIGEPLAGGLAVTNSLPKGSFLFSCGGLRTMPFAVITPRP